jgi:hypothetical protein
MKIFNYITISFILIFVLACNSSENSNDQNFEALIKTVDAIDLIARGDGDEDNGDNDGSSSNDVIAEEGTLTAGNWKDLSEWAFWQSLMQKEMFFDFQQFWGFYPNQRYTVVVTDKNNNPVMDCQVKLLNNSKNVIWEAKTNNSGTAELFSEPFTKNNVLAASVLIEHKGKSYKISKLLSYNKGLNNFKIPLITDLPDNLTEVMFIVDATGSMEDEINYLRKELEDVVSQVNTSKPEMTLNIGSVFYRDTGDEYVSRSSPLSSNPSQALNFMNEQSAKGGGDYPEAVDVALYEAIIKQDWSTSARSRIAFLMLDAPPHNDAKTLKKVQDAIVVAAAKGIQLIPIAASGMDKETEFLMRFFAITTNGSYVFITDHSGVGNGHIEPTIGEYRVEYLNDLLAKIIINSSTALVEPIQ